MEKNRRFCFHFFPSKKGPFFFGSSYFKYRGGGGTPKNMMIYTNYYMFLWLLYVFYLYVFVVPANCKKVGMLSNPPKSDYPDYYKFRDPWDPWDPMVQKPSPSTMNTGWGCQQEPLR